jgi:hypothetical protein
MHTSEYSIRSVNSAYKEAAHTESFPDVKINIFHDPEGGGQVQLSMKLDKHQFSLSIAAIKRKSNCSSTPGGSGWWSRVTAATRSSSLASFLVYAAIFGMMLPLAMVASPGLSSAWAAQPATDGSPPALVDPGGLSGASVDQPATAGPAAVSFNTADLSTASAIQPDPVNLPTASSGTVSLSATLPALAEDSLDPAGPPEDFLDSARGPLALPGPVNLSQNFPNQARDPLASLDPINLSLDSLRLANPFTDTLDLPALVGLPDRRAKGMAERVEAKMIAEGEEQGDLDTTRQLEADLEDMRQQEKKYLYWHSWCRRGFDDQPEDSPVAQDREAELVRLDGQDGQQKD